MHILLYIISGKKSITAATKILHLQLKRLFPFYYWVVMAILRRFLPLMHCFWPLNDGNQLPDCRFFHL